MRIPKGFVDRTLSKFYEDQNVELLFYPYISRPSNIYGETLGKSYGTPILALGYLEMEPTTLRLKDLGWDLQNINILARFSYLTLLNAGLMNSDGTPVFNNSYLIESFGKKYAIVDFQLREPFVDGKPSLVYITGRKYVDGK